MKKLFVLLVFAASSMFVSCSSDDDNGGGTEAQIVGKWEISQEGTIVNNQEVLSPYEHEAPQCGKDFVEFQANNTAMSKYFFLDIDDQCASEEDIFTYSVSGQNLTITSDGDVTTTEILTLSNTTLKIKGTEVFDNQTYVYIMVFTRI